MVISKGADIFSVDAEYSALSHHLWMCFHLLKITPLVQMKSVSFKQRLISEITGVYGGRGRVTKCGGRVDGLLADF